MREEVTIIFESPLNGKIDQEVLTIPSRRAVQILNKHQYDKIVSVYGDGFYARWLRKEAELSKNPNYKVSPVSAVSMAAEASGQTIAEVMSKVKRFGVKFVRH